MNEVELRAAYDRDGYVAIREFVSGEALTELVEHVERFIRDIVPQLPREHAFYEDKADPSSLKQIQKMGEHDPWFHDLVMDSPFQRLAELLIGAPVAPQNLQYFCKPPGVGRPTPPHQDGYYFMLDPCEAVTLWLALDHVDEENGCVRYVRGSHRGGMRGHGRTDTLGFSQGIGDYAPAEEDALQAAPGDLLAHHAMTIHRADGNHSETRQRRALGFVYFSQRARRDEEAIAAYQRKLSEEMRAAGKI